MVLNQFGASRLSGLIADAAGISWGPPPKAAPAEFALREHAHSFPKDRVNP
jgi:hypothetical protein